MATIGVNDMKESIEKAEILLEAVPYIQKFNNKRIIIKYGGSAMSNESIRKSVIKDIAMLKLLGLKPIIVHGGGKDISKMLSAMGKKSVFLDGLRVTDEETAKIAEMVLVGSIGKQLVLDLEREGINAISIEGKDGHTLLAKKKIDPSGRDLGYVGEIEKVDTTLIEALLEKDYVPVISPIAFGEDGMTYNINADYGASAIAGALKCQKLVFLTDVEGILKDPKDPTSKITKITMESAMSYIKDGTISGGMIPKVTCCLDALEKGVKSVHILNGKTPHSILLEIYTTKGIGTMFTLKEEEE
ncbi:MAG: acetylglutamate kinase [Spirochaetaceae bacterium]|nr:acetylglutamate kinase [Spirochaetaceae bacterium]